MFFAEYQGRRSASLPSGHPQPATLGCARALQRADRSALVFTLPIPPQSQWPPATAHGDNHSSPPRWLRSDTEKRGSTEKLAIFGERRGQRGAELKVMSAVEQKMPGCDTMPRSMFSRRAICKLAPLGALLGLGLLPASIIPCLSVPRGGVFHVRRTHTREGFADVCPTHGRISDSSLSHTLACLASSFCRRRLVPSTDRPPIACAGSVWLHRHQ